MPKNSFWHIFRHLPLFWFRLYCLNAHGSKHTARHLLGNAEVSQRQRITHRATRPLLPWLTSVSCFPGSTGQPCAPQGQSKEPVSSWRTERDQESSVQPQSLEDPLLLQRLRDNTLCLPGRVSVRTSVFWTLFCISSFATLPATSYWARTSSSLFLLPPLLLWSFLHSVSHQTLLVVPLPHRNPLALSLPFLPPLFPKVVTTWETTTHPAW